MAVLLGVVAVAAVVCGCCLNGCRGKKLKLAARASVDRISRTCFMIDGLA